MYPGLKPGKIHHCLAGPVNGRPGTLDDLSTDRSGTGNLALLHREILARSMTPLGEESLPGSGIGLRATWRL